MIEWTKPELIILARNRREEAVWTICKSEGNAIDSTGQNNNCVTWDTACADVCSYTAVS